MSLFGFEILDLGAQDTINLSDVTGGLIPDGTDACCGSNFACNKNRNPEHGQK